MGQDKYNVIIASDFRFTGGTSASNHEEIIAQSNNGLRTGLFHVPSRQPGKSPWRSWLKFRKRRPYNPKILNAVAAGKADWLGRRQSAQTETLIIRHPTVVPPRGRGRLPRVKADNIVLVINHPPVTVGGRVDYDLPAIIDNLKRIYGVTPYVCPNSPLVEKAVIQSYERHDLIDFKWWNIIDQAAWDIERTAPTQEQPLKIGRHGRAHREKWPDNADDILQCYPERNDIKVRVLGGADVAGNIIGYVPENWTAYKFNEIDPKTFLGELDVFVYFHHPEWVEAFPRTVLEAMASGLPCILPESMQPLFGSAAICCRPGDVAKHLEALRDPGHYAHLSELSRDLVKQRFSHDTHIRRLQWLKGDTPS